MRTLLATAAAVIVIFTAIDLVGLPLADPKLRAPRRSRSATLADPLAHQRTAT